MSRERNKAFVKEVSTAHALSTLMFEEDHSFLEMLGESLTKIGELETES